MKKNCFLNDSKLTLEEKEKMLVETCQKVFGTEDGKLVLYMLLTDMSYFADSRTKREKFLNDYAKFFIRERLGVRDGKSITDFIAQTAFEQTGFEQTPFETAASEGGK